MIVGPAILIDAGVFVVIDPLYHELWLCNRIRQKDSSHLILP